MHSGTVLITKHRRRTPRCHMSQNEEKQGRCERQSLMLEETEERSVHSGPQETSKHKKHVKEGKEVDRGRYCRVVERDVAED